MVEPTDNERTDELVAEAVVRAIAENSDPVAAAAQAAGREGAWTLAACGKASEVYRAARTVWLRGEVPSNSSVRTELERSGGRVGDVNRFSLLMRVIKPLLGVPPEIHQAERMEPQNEKEGVEQPAQAEPEERGLIPVATHKAVLASFANEARMLTDRLEAIHREAISKADSERDRILAERAADQQRYEKQLAAADEAHKASEKRGARHHRQVLLLSSLVAAMFASGVVYLWVGYSSMAALTKAERLHQEKLSAMEQRLEQERGKAAAERQRLLDAALAGQGRSTTGAEVRP